MFRSIKNHVRLEKTPLEEYSMVVQLSEDSAEHFFCYPLAVFSRVRPVRQNFRFNNRHKSVLLANQGVLSQTDGVLADSLVAWTSFFDFKDSSPLSKPAAKLIELSSHGGQLLETFGEAFFFGSV